MKSIFARLTKTRLRRWIMIILGLVACLSLLMSWRVNRAANGRVFVDAAAVPPENSPRIALVMGAGVWADNTPSPVLYDRIATAVELYRAGRVDKLLMSGDNRFKNYNEPEVMRQTAQEMGVPPADIVLDYAGRRTYDSCYRARNIFEAERVIIVSQEFHLARSIYLCESLGIDSLGVPADKRDYTRTSRMRWAVREKLAQITAWLDINFWQPTPVLGKKLPIR